MTTDTRTFSHAEWDALLTQSIAMIQELSKKKGGEYAGDDDRLANFRRNAAACGASMELIWRVYAGKHWDAVSQYVADISHGKTRERMEPIEGRIDDLLVYLLLFKAIVWERERAHILQEDNDRKQTF